MWYLARHAQTIWNAEKRYQSSRNLPLTEQGQAEQSVLTQVLVSLPGIQAVLTSDLDRCLSLAREVAEQLSVPLHVSSDLRELDFGQWEGLTWDEIMAGYPAEQAAWLVDPWRVSPPGGETLQQLAGRLRTTLDSWLQQTVIVITHAGVIAQVLQEKLGQEFLLPRTGQWIAFDPKSRGGEANHK